METDFEQLLALLNRERVRFILIGGLAGMSHGSNRATLDVDVVYERSPENIRRLVQALKLHRPYLRGAPAGLPFSWDEKTVQFGLNFTLTTDIGDLDVLGEVPGGGTYRDLLPHTEPRQVFGTDCLVVTLDKLIELKRAAGRVKDLEAIAELIALREEQDRLGGN